VSTRFYGVYNASGQGAPSRLDVAKAIVKEMGYDVPVHGVDSQHFKKEYGAPRPRHEVLVNSRLRLRGDLDTSNDWRYALNHYLGGYRQL
jgi:dTDP-4-dehydrorhamnose reductase